MAHNYNFDNQPNNERYGMARFLLGMGPMPPPTNQELAMARLQHSLNHGMYGGPQYGDNPPRQHNPGDMQFPTYNFRPQAPSLGTPGPVQSQDASHNTPPNNSGQTNSLREFSMSQSNHKTHHPLPELEVHVPAPPEPESASTQATIAPPIRLAFSIDDISPGDFLARICANMNMTVAEAQLGWKTSAELKKALPHPLRTENDVIAALEHFRPILSSTRRTKKVWMEITNLVKAAEKATPVPKVTETAYRDELNVVKTALACEKHRGRNRWCFVRRDDEAGPRCVPLGLEEITLWARKLVRRY
ncbi:hypothetical protein DFH08DRAFT_763348 [Mycena albidolilacea]|uniref:Uncharacterized protein n=1 Tax=Mycena albidolilacea TaxID=1033008 RepID=A0AAD7AQZ7_9AGAR|nr:hypothetical protein DFH08DRAFT_763348 [Mycena albidolilacea]